mmetsp:Transcript_5171/g.11222  ORF Transcript_5171/g.11222 Transcript_5171/m.11222 type:complete len:294 (+) Transcript_5171:125-1006(+)
MIVSMNSTDFCSAIHGDLVVTPKSPFQDKTEFIFPINSSTPLQFVVLLIANVIYHLRQRALQALRRRPKIFHKLLVTRLLPVDDVCHDLDPEVRDVPDLRAPRYRRRLHVLHASVVLEHVMRVQLMKVERVSRGAHAQLVVERARQVLHRRRLDPPHPVGGEVGYGDATVVVGDGGGEEDVPDGRALATESAARAGVDEEMGRIVVTLQLLQGEEGRDGCGDGPDVVYSRAVDVVLPVGDDGEVAVVVLTTEGAKGSLGGEEGGVGLEVEVVDERCGLSLHRNGYDDVGYGHI